MARKQKAPGAGPNMAYLMSFGDTMTTLLAFFIVLNSLAKEQTGAKLYAGTGSFVSAVSSFGMPGSAPGDNSRHVIKMEEPVPTYVVPDPEGGEPEMGARDPDDKNDALRVVDREQEDHERFLREMDRLFDVKQLRKTKSSLAIDIFNPLVEDEPYLSELHYKAVGQVLPMLYRDNFQVDVVVWATTPSPTAWKRATQQSKVISDRIAIMANLSPENRARLKGVGRPWFDATAERPVLSFVVRKMDDA